jgi:hypothetical protein
MEIFDRDGLKAALAGLSDRGKLESASYLAYRARRRRLGWWLSFPTFVLGLSVHVATYSPGMPSPGYSPATSAPTAQS